MASSSSSRPALIWAGLYLCAVGIGCGGGTPKRTDPDVGAQPASVVEVDGTRLNRAKLDYLSLLTRGRVVDDAEWQGWQADNTTRSEVVEIFVSDDFVGKEVASRLLFRVYESRMAVGVHNPGYGLSPVQHRGEKVYRLRSSCNVRNSKSVRPWWDMETTVKICADDHRPEVWETQRSGGITVPCSTTLGSPGSAPKSTCGCGPNLIRCFPRDIPRHNDAARAEVIDTVRDVVSKRRPLAEIFTRKDTYRSREVELMYRRNVVESYRMADPSEFLAEVKEWPAEPTPMPRREYLPGQHAGVLTAPHLHYMTGSFRQRMRIYFETLWCIPVSAPGALPEHVLSLKTADLRDNSNDLSSRPICTNCHARLESAMTFFQYYPSPQKDASHFVDVQDLPTSSRLYGNHIRDPRQTAPPTPEGFASLAVRQPEFLRCMAENVGGYVFGPRSSDGLFRSISADLTPQTVTLDGLLRRTINLFLDCESCKVPDVGRPTLAPWSDDKTTFAELVEEECTTCHFDGASVASFEGALTDDQVLRLADQALSGRMPPTSPLDTSVRLDFLRAAARHLESGGSSLETSFLRVHSDPPPALPIFAARAAAHRVANTGTRAKPISAHENAFKGGLNVFSPNYAILTGLETVAACRPIKDATKRQACFDRVLDTVFEISPEH